MTVEFVGPPGAGKSTIARELARLTGQSSVTLDGYRTLQGRVLSSREVTLERWWSLVSQPRLAWAALDCARREGRGLALSWMINLARRNRMMESVKGGGLILEEGTLSALCLARAARSQPWEMISVLPNLAHGQSIVIVDTDEDTIAQRIRERRGILADRDADSLKDLVLAYKAALDELGAALNPAPVHVTSDQHPGVIAEQLRDLLSRPSPDRRA